MTSPSAARQSSNPFDFASVRAQQFDEKFDRGEDITASLDLAGMRRPGREVRRVNVDFPAWMVDSLDREAKRLGVTRQSIIKIWIAERLEHSDGSAA